MPEPVLSVVIPAYNVERYIEAAVRSALGQSFRDLEVIVVDDGSTDATPEILAQLGQQLDDPRLRVVTRANGGLSAARNTGIKAGCSRLIGFLDGDDLWRPEKMARHVELMLADPRFGITFSDSEYLTDAGELTDRYHASSLARPTLWQMIRRNHIGNGSSPVVRRECFETAGLFNETLRSCEDYEMWARIVHSTRCRIGRIPLPLTLYRIRETSLSASFDKFLANSDRAIALLRRQMPLVPDRIFREGHAVHYRIASRKAISFGSPRMAAGYLRRALDICPWLLLVDPRALPTALLIASAGHGEMLLHAAQAALMRRSGMNPGRNSGA
ncbi:MAG: glycosyltransferase family A protein [Geminicoccaceae bacterium]